MTPIIAEVPLPAIISASSGLLLAIIGLISYLAKGIFAYLITRIKTLEDREQNVLSGMVDSIESISGSVKSTADFIVHLADESRYNERRRREEEGRP